MASEAGLLTLLFLGVLFYLHVTQRERVRAERRALFDGCRQGFTQVEIRQDGLNYPVLDGRYRDFDVRIEAVVDHVAFRKLPQLLAMVTLRAAVPCRAMVDVLARPQNTEFYAPWNRLAYTVSGRPGWPVHVVARSDSPDPLPFLDVLDRWMPSFEDVKMKELLITRRGVRLVYRLREGERGPYLLLRQAAFDGARLEAPDATRLLGTLIALHDDLCGGSSRPAPADPGNVRTHAVT
jgi:hypothetical protein